MGGAFQAKSNTCHTPTPLASTLHPPQYAMSLMEKCASCSKTNRWLIQTNRRIEEINACTARYFHTIQKLLQELNESSAENKIDTDGDEGEHENDDADSDDIDVTCAVPCAGCHTTLVRVSTLKRHFTDCAGIKDKRTMSGHTKAIEQMKNQIDIESKMASHAARAALQSCKRLRQTKSNILRPRKKSKSETYPGYSSSASRAFDQQQSGCTDDNEQQSQVPRTTMNAIPSSYSGDNQGRAQNVTTGMGDLEVTSEKIDEMLVYLENDQCSTVPDMHAAAIDPSGLNESTNEPTMYHDKQYPAIGNPISATNAPSTIFANDQPSAARSTSHAIRGSSFLSYTMDGSFMYPDGQYPISQNTTLAKRGSSFTRNTMDGSFMYTDSSHVTAQSIATENSGSWRLS
ncbi:hypothetical protein BB8028_0009g01830 [Beauveria bassiana]|uniref:Uncharacterized protein n=1 Tax=Beauveria bassiana TaxID=176275 RepID=A0A2S7YP63_BEABA|nr:hypothetical protein BB8028_0009g01830 [Beauveria bassiana]